MVVYCLLRENQPSISSEIQGYPITKKRHISSELTEPAESHSTLQSVQAATSGRSIGQEGDITSQSVDIGTLVQQAGGSWETLKKLSRELSDKRRMQFLTKHCKPRPSQLLHRHKVTKNEKTWTVSFQRTWLDRFPWLSYSNFVKGGLCRYCIVFPDSPTRGGGQGASPGVLVLSAYKYSYAKALGKDGILVCHEQSQMHRNSEQLVDVFIQTERNPNARVDTQLLAQADHQSQTNKEILREIVLAAEFLSKQGLPFRGHRDDKVDFDEEKTNKGNFIATLQLLGKSNPILQNHLVSAQRNAKYSSKTI